MKNKKINLNINAFAKKLNKFTKAYSTKSLDLKNKIKNISHNEYLKYSSKIYGLQSYNHYLKNKKDSVLIENIEKKLPIFLNSLSLNDTFNKEQFINTFLLFISNDISSLKSNHSSLKGMITRYLNKKGALKEKNEYNDYSYLCENIIKSYKIYNKEKLKNILFDYKSVAGGFELDSLDNDIVNKMFKQIDLRNAILIKNHISDKNTFKIEDISKFEIYCKESNNKYYPYELIHFLHQDDMDHHHGMYMTGWRSILTGYDDFLLKEKNGEWSLKKAVFKSVFNKKVQNPKNNQIALFRTEEDYAIVEFEILNGKILYFLMYDDFCVFETHTKEGAFYNVYCSYDELKWITSFWKRSENNSTVSSFYYPKSKNDGMILEFTYLDGNQSIIEINNKTFNSINFEKIYKGILKYGNFEEKKPIENVKENLDNIEDFNFEDDFKENKFNKNIKDDQDSDLDNFDFDFEN